MPLVEGYRWVGLMADDFEETLEFFSEVLGFELESMDDEKVVAMFRFPSGQLFEVFGSANRPRKHKYRLMDGPVIGLEVGDVEAVRSELVAKGVEFITGVEADPGGATWAYFLGPDNRMYTIQNQGD